MKLSRTYSRKDFREKSLVGHFIGYSEEGEIKYEIFFPEHIETIVEIKKF